MNPKIRCLIVDDEPPALDVLKKYIAAVSSLELVASCENAVEAANFLHENRVDLLFLDIQLPDLLGTDLVKTLKNPPRIIFTTAYRNFAIDAFDLDAKDYLLKPISFERFLKAVNKIIESISVVQIPDKPGVNVESQFPKSFITVRAERKNINIPFNEILFIESLRDYVKIVTLSKNIISNQSISSLEALLPKENFIRIHRSYIVSIDKIETFTNENLTIRHNELPIGRVYRREAGKVLSGQKYEEQASGNKIKKE